MTERRTTRLVREGSLIAEVDVTLLESDHDWSPYLSGADVRKLDDVRKALQRRDVKAAVALGGRVYTLQPVAAE